MGSFSNFVGHRIKKYRKSRGYTIEQFSAMINKSKATLSKYENGAITIDIETLYEISQALDIDLKYFVDYQPPTFRNEPALHKNCLLYTSYMDAKELQMKCLEKKVAFVPGGSFFPNGGHENTLRLNYSCMPEEKIVQGITALCQTIKENLK